MKTKISQVVTAVFFTLLLIGGNVNAKGTELVASSHENIKESALEVEDWMINDNYWNTSDAAFFIEEVAEENLKLESWMINKFSWDKQSVCFIENEFENDLNLESWMVNENIWNRQ